jgi:hypothetical protein
MTSLSWRALFALPPTPFVPAPLPEGHQECPTCTGVRRFAVWPGSNGAPDFNCCQSCGNGFCITPEEAEESA